MVGSGLERVPEREDFGLEEGGGELVFERAFTRVPMPSGRSCEGEKGVRVRESF